MSKILFSNIFLDVVNNSGFILCEQGVKVPPDLRLIDIDKVMVISRLISFQSEGHFKVMVLCRSMLFQGQGHFKVKIISRSRSFQYGSYES